MIASSASLCRNLPYRYKIDFEVVKEFTLSLKEPFFQIGVYVKF